MEVCANLREGGVTPSIGLVSHIVRLLRRKPKTRVHVLCRPRAGDFHYNDEEFEVRAGRRHADCQYIDVSPSHP